MSKGSIGFIGLGNMGLPMVRNLGAAGYEVLAWNRTTPAANALPPGARLVASPGEAARCGVVITIVADDAALEAVTLGEQGLIHGLPPGGLHVSMSTVGTHTAQKLALAHAADGSRYLAAPVFGRPDAAAAAKLKIVAAGDEADYARMVEIFAVLGERAFKVGDRPEQANTVKLAGNFLLLAMLEALGEAFALTAKAGVSTEQVLEIVNGSLIRSPVYENYARIVIDKRYQPAGFKLRLGLKDANLVLAAANASQVPMPTASLVRDRLLGGVARGKGELDWAYLAQLVAEDAGLG